MRYTEAQKRELVSAWQETNQSRKQFSQSRSLCYASFLKWSKQYCEKGEADNGFIKLEDNFGSSIKIILPNGVLIQTDQALSMALIKSLSNV